MFARKVGREISKTAAKVNENMKYAIEKIVQTADLHDSETIFLRF